MNTKVVIITLVGLALLVGMVYAYPEGVTRFQGRRMFVDTDNDGICDNYQAGECHGYGNGNGFQDADNDGICDNYQAGNCYGNCSGFQDADNDGICDNCGQEQQNRYRRGCKRP
ncbi:MAG: hypothetical protein PVF58_11625 [Candidatus Methanofastidiosia archaeon]